MSTAFLLEVKMTSHCPLVGFWGLDRFAKTSGLDTLPNLKANEHIKQAVFGLTLIFRHESLQKSMFGEDLTVLWFLSNNRKRGSAAAGCFPQDVAWLGSSQTCSPTSEPHS